MTELALNHERLRVPSRDVIGSAASASPHRSLASRRRFVSRPALLATMNQADGGLLVLSAPAGYGKTTTLLAWESADRRPHAWLTLDRWDDDPSVLLADVANALARIGVLDPAYSHAAAEAPVERADRWARDVMRSVTPDAPFVLVLDDADAIRAPRSLDLLRAMIAHLPPGSCLAVAGRSAPRIPLARLRAAGRLVEIGPDELAFSDDDAFRLLRGAGATPTKATAAEVNRCCEGWAAGLHLAARVLSDDGADVPDLSGLEGAILDYVREEFLPILSPDQASFLRRSAILDELSGPLCDSTLGRADSASILEDLEREHRLVSRIDPRGLWFRHHRLMRSALLSEAQRRESDKLPMLHIRAARWLMQHDRPSEAIEHFRAAGDHSMAARILCDRAGRLVMSGRGARVRSWLAAAGDHEAQDGPLPATAAVVLALGERRGARTWLNRAAAGRDSDDSSIALARYARALLCAHGPEAMEADARWSLAHSLPHGQWRSGILVVHSASQLLLGHAARAAGGFEEVITAAQEREVLPLTAAHAQLGLIAADAGDWPAARSHALEARRCAVDAGIEDDSTQALPSALDALVAACAGETARAARAADHARRIAPVGDGALPWLGAQVRITLARAFLRIGDTAAARTVLLEAAAMRQRSGGLGVLDGALDVLDTETLATGSSAGAASLTPAELRVLRHLQSHLTIREIADQLFVSRNTVKSQAMGIYRKLGVSGRSEAIIRARERRILAPPS